MKKTTEEQSLLGPKMAADYVGLHYQGLRYHHLLGHLPYIQHGKDGSRIAYRKSDLDEFQEKYLSNRVTED